MISGEHERLFRETLTDLAATDPDRYEDCAALLFLFAQLDAHGRAEVFKACMREASRLHPGVVT